MVSIHENPSKFCPAEREIVLQALEECTDGLAVYQSTLKQSMARDTVDAFPEIGISKMSILQSLNGDAAGVMTDLQKQAVREKLRRNSLYVNGIIQDLKREISEHGTIEILIKEIKRIILQENEERVLLEKNKRMKMAATELRKTTTDQKMSSEKEEEHLIKKLNWTRDEKEKLKLVTNVEIRYIREWEKARNEQNLLRYELKINKMQKTFNDYYVRERNENRVNNELIHYLTQRITFIENRIEKWQQRYDIEKKMYEKEIRKARSEIEEVQADLKKLTTEYCSNQEFIDTYLAEQETLRRQKEHENHVCRSVIRMQAWWRGVMVRRKLGPYRPEEKKKKRVVKTKK